MKSIWQIEQSRYNNLLNLPYSSWAWEFKRRDPELINAYETGQTIRPDYQLKSDGIGVFSLPKPCKIAESFGLHFLPDPSLHANESIAFWLPEVMQFNFDASVEILNTSRHKDKVLHWKNIPGEKNVLFSPCRRTKLSVSDHSYATQFAIEANLVSVLETKYLSLKVGEKHLKQDNIVHISEFSTHCQGQNTSHRFRRGYFPETLKQALIALDGVINNATQRDISSALFGATQTQLDWDNGIFSLKSRTRRLIKKGRDLMTRDYLKLL